MRATGPLFPPMSRLRSSRSHVSCRRAVAYPWLPAPGRPIYVEHEYVRAGGLAYLAAWDARRAGLLGRFERKNGVAAVHRLVGQIMGQEPYRSAGRVFLVADNGSCHGGRRAADRLRARRSNILLVYTPVRQLAQPDQSGT